MALGQFLLLGSSSWQSTAWEKWSVLFLNSFLLPSTSLVHLLHFLLSTIIISTLNTDLLIPFLVPLRVKSEMSLRSFTGP